MLRVAAPCAGQNPCTNECVFQECGQSYRCAHNGCVHECGDKCRARIRTNEGWVCRLTGRCLGAIDELHRPFNQNGRSQAHFVMRRMSHGRRPKGNVDITGIKAQALIHEALVAILNGGQRRMLQESIRERFRKECVRAAKRANGNFMTASLMLQSTVDMHIAQLLPTTDQSQHVDRLSHAIHNFLVNLDLAMANAKAVRVFAAVCFDMLAAPADFVVLGRSFVKASRWCRMHAISTAMYPQIGFASRAMTACTRQMRAAMVRPLKSLPFAAVILMPYRRTSKVNRSHCRRSNSRYEGTPLHRSSALQPNIHCNRGV